MKKVTIKISKGFEDAAYRAMNNRRSMTSGYFHGSMATGYWFWDGKTEYIGYTMRDFFKAALDNAIGAGNYKFIENE